MRFASITAIALLAIGAFATLPTAPAVTTTTPAPPPTPTATPVPTPAKSLVWADLFAPPFNGLPEISMSISCVDPTLCYLPGGSNGAGFQIFSFNGQENGFLNPMNEPDMTMMIMSVTAAGTKANPIGVFAGVGIGINNMSAPIQYLTNGTWMPSQVPAALFTEVQSLRTTDDGKHIIGLGAGITGTNIMHSTDFGKTFQPLPYNITLADPNCTAPMYGAMPTNNTWYMTLGSSPGNGNSGSGSHSAPSDSSSFDGATYVRPETFASTITRNAQGKLERKFHSNLQGHKLREGKTEKCPGYTGQIAKTTDGGKTWKSQVTQTQYSFAQIDCTSATHCVTVAYGVENGQQVSLVFLTTDGETWKQVYSIASNETVSYGFQAIKFVDAHEAWIGGSVSIGQQNFGALWYSKDGGKTWQMDNSLQPNIVIVFDLSFSKGVGYAVAMTELKTATILRYKQQYFDGFFTQSNCAFAKCIACQNMSFPQGMCMTTQGGSVQAFCDDGEIVSQNYQTTSCVGSFTVSTMPINVCLNSTQGGFFENFCEPPTQTRVQKNAKKMRRF